MGSCARIHGLGANIVSGTGTSTIGVRVGVRVSGSKGRRARVNLLGGTAYILVLDIDYHHYTWAHARGYMDLARFRVAVQARQHS